MMRWIHRLGDIEKVPVDSTPRGDLIVGRDDDLRIEFFGEHRLDMLLSEVLNLTHVFFPSFLHFSG